MASIDSASAATRAVESAALPPSPRLVRAAFAALCALTLAAVFVRSLNPDALNWDVGCLLHFAGRMLDGDRLYVDLMDENPPMIFWLNLPAAAAARLLGLPPMPVFHGFVAALGLLSSWLSYRVLRAAWPEAPAAHSLGLAGLLLCLLLVAPGQDFGQRENLLFIAMVPYLFCAAARASGRSAPARLAAVAGLLAGLGIAIKPQFLLAWIAIESAVLASTRDRWRCLENAAIVAVQAAYAAAVLAFASEYLAWMAMLSQVVLSYQELGVASIRWTGVVCVSGATLLFVLAPANRLDLGMRRVLLAAALSMLAIALLSRADFSYRYYPAEAAAVLLAGVIVLGRALHANAAGTAWRARVAALPLVCLLAFGAWSGGILARETAQVVAPGPNQDTVVRLLSNLVTERAHGRPIWVISTEVWPGFPVVNLTGASWTSRFCCVVIAALAYSPEEKATVPFPYHDLDRLTELEQLQFDAVVEDLQREPPVLLIVDTGTTKQTFGKTDFQFLPYFRRDPRFERIFREYRPIGQIGKFHVYQRRLLGS